MAGWKKRFARRRAEEGGRVALFVGVFVASLVLTLGIICLVMDKIPIGTRHGPIWIGPPRKNTIGGCFVSIAATLHFWFFWTHVGGLKRIAAVAAVGALLAAAYCFLATMS